jgi:hypothetical protein
VKRIYLLSFTFILLLPLVFFGQEPNAIPTIRLDKSRFVVGEQVGFWIGVKQTNDAPILEKYRDTCRVIITRPDGTQRIDKVSWPIDGMVDRGWTGGWGLRGEAIQIGRYALNFEFAGQKTAPVYLFVDDLPILKQIKAQFVFAGLTDDRSILDVRTPTDEKVAFRLKNGTDQTLRFVAINETWNFMMGSHIRISIRREGEYSNDFGLVDGGLLNTSNLVGTGSYDDFTWDVADKLPTITLKPGGTYERVLLLQTALDQANETLRFAPGEYKVTFSTSLKILVGERDGPWADRSPLTLASSGTVNCSIRQ